MNKFTYIALLLFFSFTLCVADAHARLSGELGWGYAHFEQTSDVDDKKSASHFFQRYSLLYSTEGLLEGGRAGAYNVSVGAEWADFDADLNGEDLGRDATKLLYNGRLQIAPGGLPFRLDAYSYDLVKTTFQTDDYYYDSPLRPGIVTDLINGQTIVSGVRFMAGIRNGSYLGKYRELMSKWPRVLVDYRDVYRRDMNAIDPEEFRISDLAFVSLNKKDNWFHYRVRKYTDYQDSSEDTVETSFLLGTIDHLLKRQWINLTNWIKISVDGSFTKLEENWDTRTVERYDINFFTLMQRRNFTAANYLSLRHVKQGESITDTLDVPVYASKRFNLDTSMSSSFNLWRHREIASEQIFERDEDSYHTHVRFETNQRGLVRIDPSVEMEVATGSVGDGEAVRGRVELYNNMRRRHNLNWSGMASLARFTGTPEYGDDASLWEGEVEGRATSRIRLNLEVGGGAGLLYGDGTYDKRVTRYMRSQTAGGFGRNSGTDSQIVDGSLLRSYANMYIEHTSSGRVRNRLEVDTNFQDDDSEQLSNLTLTHTLFYDSRKWRVRMENYYGIGDDLASLGSISLVQSFETDSNKGMFQQRNVMDFKPSKYWTNRLETTLFWGQDFQGQSGKYLRVQQAMERIFYQPGARERKWSEVRQEMEYEYLQYIKDRQSFRFSLAGSYYPTTFWRMGARISYYDYDFSNNVIYYTLTSSLDFPKFNVDFSYRYGAREEDNVVAHRYEVNVRKTF